MQLQDHVHKRSKTQDTLLDEHQQQSAIPDFARCASFEKARPRNSSISSSMTHLNLSIDSCHSFENSAWDKDEMFKLDNGKLTDQTATTSPMDLSNQLNIDFSHFVVKNPLSNTTLGTDCMDSSNCLENISHTHLPLPIDVHQGNFGLSENMAPSSKPIGKKDSGLYPTDYSLDSLFSSTVFSPVSDYQKSPMILSSSEPFVSFDSNAAWPEEYGKPPRARSKTDNISIKTRKRSEYHRIAPYDDGREKSFADTSFRTHSKRSSMGNSPVYSSILQSGSAFPKFNRPKSAAPPNLQLAMLFDGNEMLNSANSAPVLPFGSQIESPCSAPCHVSHFADDIFGSILDSNMDLSSKVHSTGSSIDPMSFHSRNSGNECFNGFPAGNNSVLNSAASYINHSLNSNLNAPDSPHFGNFEKISVDTPFGVPSPTANSMKSPLVSESTSESSDKNQRRKKAKSTFRPDPKILAKDKKLERKKVSTPRITTKLVDYNLPASMDSNVDEVLLSYTSDMHLSNSCMTPITPSERSARTDVFEDEDEEPRQQDVPSASDIYTPKWVRFSGAKKQGLCEHCKPGKWFLLKNSAYWYHQVVCHGISSITKTYFKPPQHVRIVWKGNENDGLTSLRLVVEGYCADCTEYISINRPKRRPVAVIATNLARETLLGHHPDLPEAQKPVVLSDFPLKISASFTPSGKLFAPPNMAIPSTIEAETMEIYEKKCELTVWNRHAQKCQSQKPSKTDNDLQKTI